ncbi:MAG: hypothetical protein RMN25_05080 [Anaerolineae bacterium]|nr:hypothetical protein [Thermoflexales bacterium]MDW8407138.1 hypothetical protein [Anaerolineae bacterium]
MIDQRDIERAIKRANLLRKAGYRSVPVVAGSRLSNQELADLIAKSHVALLVNGSSTGWEEAR